jgi:hypothetical protein
MRYKKWRMESMIIGGRRTMADATRYLESLSSGVEGGRADDMPKDMTRRPFPGFDTPHLHAAFLQLLSRTVNSL